MTSQTVRYTNKHQRNVSTEFTTTMQQKRKCRPGWRRAKWGRDQSSQTSLWTNSPCELTAAQVQLSFLKAE